MYEEASLKFRHQQAPTLLPVVAFYVVANGKKQKGKQVISEAGATSLAKFFVKLWKENPDFGFALLAEDAEDKTTPPGKPP